MKLQATVKYQFTETLQRILVFYAILLVALFVPTLWRGTIEFRGTELATAIFIFVIGLNSFKTNFLFAQVNGISRKTQFKAFVISILAISMILALIDTVYTNLFASFLPSVSLFSMIYESGPIFDLSLVLLLFINLIWNFLLYMMFAMFGYFVNLVYYRSGLIMKLVVSIIPPIFAIVVLPYLAFVNPVFSKGIQQFATFALGLSGSPNPTYSMVTFGFFFVVFSFGSFLLMRRAPIK